MTIVWTLIASFLYVEIAVVLVLMLPIFSVSRWQRFFKSRFFAIIEKQVHVYFYLLIAVLIVFLLDSIREMRKFGHFDMEHEVHLNAELQHNMRLFRAQRNFYISGFAIFLTVVIRRLVILITTQADILNMAAGGEASEDLKHQSRESYAKLEFDLLLSRKETHHEKERCKSLAKDYDKIAEENFELKKQLKVHRENFLHSKILNDSDDDE